MPLYANISLYPSCLSRQSAAIAIDRDNLWPRNLSQFTLHCVLDSAKETIWFVTMPGKAIHGKGNEEWNLSLKNTHGRRPSVCHTFFTMFLSSCYHKVYYHWQKWCPCKRSRPEVTGQGQRSQDKFCVFVFHLKIWCFRNVTPVEINRFLRNDACRLKYHRRGAF